ncbi:hypothetical protein [Actinophytocola sp. KF-1]
MGIEIELHRGRPAVPNRKASRSTLLRGSYDHGEALARLLSALPPDGGTTLPAVDPYGDTVLDQREADAALRDEPALRRLCATDRDTAAVDDLVAMLRTCATTPDGHLWFMGD